MNNLDKLNTPGGIDPLEDVHLIINHIIVTWMQFNILHEDGIVL